MTEEEKYTKETFEIDYFGRKDFAENLCNLIKGQEGYQSRVISIKADFGYGKTFFAKAFKNLIDELENNTNPHLSCHYIDIWKEDYNNNPLLALLSSLNEFIEKIDALSAEQKNKLSKALKTLSTELLKEGVSYIPIIGKATSKTIEAIANYENTSIFKDLNALKNIAELIQEAFAELKNTKMIIIIDEIDRCHPEYAIEFLETLKHFFDLENLYFILMMNENHLREKVKSKFGYIDFDMWKDKFINLEFELPNARSQEKFLGYLICEECKIQEPRNHSFKSELEIIDLQQLNNKERITKYIFKKYKTQTYSLSRSLINLTNSLDYRPNNRQLFSICKHFQLAYNILKNKPIAPIILFGIILKTYTSNLVLTKPFENAQEQDFSWIKEKDGTKSHILKYIFDAYERYNNGEPLYFKEPFSLHVEESAFFSIQIAQIDEILDNILAVQFASQANKV